MVSIAGSSAGKSYHGMDLLSEQSVETVFQSVGAHISVSDFTGRNIGMEHDISDREKIFYTMSLGGSDIFMDCGTYFDIFSRAEDGQI